MMNDASNLNNTDESKNRINVAAKIGHSVRYRVEKH